MNRKTIWIAGSAGAAALALLAWAFAPRPLEVEVAQASLGAFETTIDEDARTRLHERYVVSAPLAGRLQRLTLREGDMVTPGMLLATLTPLPSPMLDARSLREQQARTGAAEAALQRAAAQVAAAAAQRDRSAAQWRRTEQLAREGFVAPTQVDSDRLAALAAQREFDAVVQGRHVAQHELEQARAALSALRTGDAGAAFPLRSPVAGRVLKVHQASEASVGAGAPILDIGDTARLEVVAELLTGDALQAQPGRPVRIERWGGTGTLAGRVRLVEPGAFTKVSALGVEEQRVNVIIDITSPAADWASLGDGYRVAVRIVTRSEARVLRVPVSAVFPLPQPAAANGATAATPERSAVFVVEQGRARLRPVTVAARNGSLAWVQDGLRAADVVIVYPPAAIVDGARVRGRPE